MLYVHTRILPDTPYITLRGQPAEASGQEVAGRVMISLGRSIKIKSVRISFQSRSSTRHLSRRQNAISGDLQLTQPLFEATAPAGFETWQPTSEAREFPFSFAIPGHLHESVATEYGQIGYELKVTLRTCGFGINVWTESLKIPVYRVPEDGTPWALSLAESMQLQADWLGAVELEVLSDSVAYTEKSNIGVKTVVRPLKKGYTLVDVGLKLRERIRCPTVVNKFGDTKNIENTLCESTLKTSDPEGGHMFMLPLTHEHSFDMSLTLVVAATIFDEKGEPHYLRTSIGVHIVPPMAIEGQFSHLPSYTESNDDALLLRAPASALRRPSQILAFSPSMNNLALPPPSYQAHTMSYNRHSITV
ncbi:hypothetical protein DL89DRAFT_290594 [Linderina pennispora]|uniref:Arrestin-like N-terminal domain-containing protein n=1 Tax=Linderina pennispora TaxID=61395 RepID=A0A1Y1WGX4_9FUNG|nr:uncharacterized protein DL89DRAFT_290594 [Linderina pennispora]ORX72759.1 hypothetical protein DL89DRAFT_290594 [Linderina pennispora]